MSGAGAGVEAARMIQRQETARQAQREQKLARMRGRRLTGSATPAAGYADCVSCQMRTPRADLLCTEAGEVCPICQYAVYEERPRLSLRLTIVPPLLSSLSLFAFVKLNLASSGMEGSGSWNLLSLSSALLLVLVLLFVGLSGFGLGKQGIRSVRRSRLMPEDGSFTPAQEQLVSALSWLAIVLSVASWVAAGLFLLQ